MQHRYPAGTQVFRFLFENEMDKKHWLCSMIALHHLEAYPALHKQCGKDFYLGVTQGRSHIIYWKLDISRTRLSEIPQKREILREMWKHLPLR